MITQRESLKKEIKFLECELFNAITSKDAFTQLKIYKCLDKAKSTFLNLD